MKNLKDMSLMLALACVFTISFTSCSSDDDKDMTYPVINTTDVQASPINGQTFKPGDVIHFMCLFTDNKELGSYNIEIHNNFDHHTHSTASGEEEGEDDDDHDHDHEHGHEAENAWVYNESYAIPAGTRSYTAQHDITIPTGIATGDYHFMVRLTDRAGWQQLHAVAIKITD